MTGTRKRRWLRRTLWSVAIIAVGLALWKVPLFRHHPICLTSHYKGEALAPGTVPAFWSIDNAYAVEGRLADHYVAPFTKWLDRFEVPYVASDGIVLLRLGDRIADTRDDVYNADRKTIGYLADPEERHPIWEKMPPDVRDRLLKDRRGEIDAPLCEYIRTLILRNWGRE